MKFLVLCCAAVACFLRASAEPVVNGDKIGHTSGHKNNVIGREKYPYVVQLEITDLQIKGEENTFLCGGTILSARVILTAAHCFQESSGDLEAHVVAGILHLENEAKRAQIGKMYDYQTHKGYTRLRNYEDENGDLIAFSHPNDIALVWLEEHLKYNEKVHHVELTPPNLNIVGKKGFILGWGRTEKGTCSKILRRADLRVLSNDECEYHSRGVDYLLTKGMLCIKADDEKSLQCKGDSGGPFIVDNKIAGVISRSSKMIKTLPNGKEIKTSNPKIGAVATNVGFYIEWINFNMKQGPPKDRKKKQTKPNKPERPRRPGKPGASKRT